ncbi:tRNA lysidine(34) synthetase TilS [Candidatus Parcubacteria bacterium]|nr:tRNA lysidine(34) synthetase TilS [Candidatus Parcubacteria bacterium]
MYEKVLKTIQKYHMIQPHEHIVLGLSGGADSICLLYLLKRLQEEMAFQLYAVHIHHGLRGDAADQDAIFVKGICQKLAVPCEIYYRDIRSEASLLKISEEEAGRKARYEIFHQCLNAHGKGKIAVAHHMNDQAETVLFNMMRGSSLKGLGGILPIRGVLIRPLIDCTRHEIEVFCSDNLLQYMKDYTNELCQYSRNQIRLELIPYIEKNFNPNFIRQMGNMSELVREEDAYLEEEALRLFQGVKKEATSEHVILDIDKLMLIHPVVQKRILRNVLLVLGVGLKDFEYKHILSLKALLEKESGKRISLPFGVIAQRVYQELHFLKGEQEKATWAYTLSKDDLNFYIEETGHQVKVRFFENENYTDFPQNLYTKWFDYDKIECNLAIRNRRDGDFIALTGKKKLKDYFIDEKIPREIRQNLPLVVDGSNILWVVGYRMSDYYKVTKATKTIMALEITEEQPKNGKIIDFDS